MVHTSQDYSDELDIDVFGTSRDLMELAARLGCISTHDRRGKVMYMDDFEAPNLKWNNVGSGANAAVVLSTDTALLGSQCCKITTGSNGIKRGGIQRYLAYPVKGKIGFEFAATHHSSIEAADIYLQLYDGTNLHHCYLEQNYQGSELNVYQASGVATKIQDLSEPFVDDGLFNRFKLVYDFSNDYFVRFIINNTEIDLSTFHGYTSANATDPYLIIQYYTFQTGTANITSYLDNVIITQVES